MSGPLHNSLLRPKGTLTQDIPGVAEQVRRWRAMRMSWAAIARALGRAEPTVRAEFDPEWRGRA